MNDYTMDVSGEDEEVLALLEGGVSGDDVAGDDDDDDDEVGFDDDDDDDVSGDELAELVGAAKRGRLTRKGMRRLGTMIGKRAKIIKRAKAKKMDKKQHALQRAGRIPQIPLGCNTVGVVVAGAPGTALLVPSVPVRITDFFVDTTIAASFTITSVIHGRLNLLGSADAVPASGFDPTAGAQRAPLELRKLPAGSPIAVNVVNIGLVDVQFRSWFQAIDLGTRVY